MRVRVHASCCKSESSPRGLHIIQGFSTLPPCKVTNGTSHPFSAPDFRYPVGVDAASGNVGPHFVAVATLRFLA